ncbi:hypothetical protein RUM44_004623 [Polyplax serrata]|uniref:Hyaluronidase n=1 Tax=Polyplax serrata TaxID=468196 RepID=A0ABR1B3C6_POLSC
MVRERYWPRVPLDRYHQHSDREPSGTEAQQKKTKVVLLGLGVRHKETEKKGISNRNSVSPCWISPVRINRDYTYPAAKDFKVYWNVPTFLCHKHNINFKPYTKKYGIISNANDSFRGKEINILYDPGLFPAVMKNRKGIVSDRNGGIPQLGNITDHLEAFRKVIDEVVTKDLSGLGIIDFEAWRPTFRQNWQDQVIYKNMSKDLERQYHPQWTEKKIQASAKTHFEESAREFMQKTLELALLLRPNATWGYYGFPYCYNFRSKDIPHCPDIVLKENNELLWLFNSSTALFPSIYMSSRFDEFEQVKFVVGRLNEAWRVAILKSKRNFPPVYPYIWFKYYDSENYLSKANIYTALEITRRYKMGGAVIWGASNDVNSKEKCETLLEYLKTVLGPTVARVHRNENNVEQSNSILGILNFPFLPRPKSLDVEDLEMENSMDMEPGTTPPPLFETTTDTLRAARTPSPAERNLNSWLQLFKWFFPFPSLRL